MPHANGDWKDVAVDSAISGAAAVTALLAVTAFGAVRADPVAFVYAAVVAFLVSFFAGLQAARGRHEEEPT